MPKKTASKRVVQITAEDTGDLIRNKIADEITSILKLKEKEPSKTEDIYIPLEKKQKLLMTWDYFEKCDTIV